MSYVISAPDAMIAVAADLAGLGNGIEAAAAAAALPTTNLLVAGRDEVSAAVAALFGDYARQYHAASAQAVSFHGEFVRALAAAGNRYADAEAANASPLKSLGQALLGHPTAPKSTSSATGDVSGQGGAATTSSSTAQNPVTSTVNAGQSAFAMAASPDGKYVYVANFMSPTGQMDGTVSIINTSTKAVTTVHTGITRVDQIVVSPNGKEVYVAGESVTGGTAKEAVVAINTATKTASAPIVVSNVYYEQSETTTYMAINPDGSRLYVAGYTGTTTPTGNTIAVINTATNSVVGTVPLNNGVLGGEEYLAVAPNGSSVYADNGSTLTVINTASNMVTATIPTGGGTQFGLGTVVSPDGKYVYVENTHNVSIIDTATNTVAGTISPPNYPPTLDGGLAISPDGKYLYIPAMTTDGTTASASLLVFDTATGGIGNPIPISSNVSAALSPHTVVSPDGHYVYEASPQLGTLTILDTVHATISDPIQVAAPNYLGAITATDSRAFVANNGTVPYSTVGFVNPTLASYHPLADGTGLTGTTTPGVTPTPIPPPPWWPSWLPEPTFPNIGLPDLNLPDIGLPNPNLNFPPIDWGNIPWGYIPGVNAVVDAHSLGVDLAHGNWGSAALDTAKIIKDIGGILRFL